MTAAERDPLGLTEYQRAVSDASELHGAWFGNLYAAYGHTPPKIERACGYCRRYGHTEDACPTTIDATWSEET